LFKTKHCINNQINETDTGEPLVVIKAVTKLSPANKGSTRMYLGHDLIGKYMKIILLTWIISSEGNNFTMIWETIFITEIATYVSL
jgi:hypothetical protein